MSLRSALGKRFRGKVTPKSARCSLGKRFRGKMSLMSARCTLGKRFRKEVTLKSAGKRFWETIPGESDSQECTVHSRKSISEINDAQECTVLSWGTIFGGKCRPRVHGALSGNDFGNMSSWAQWVEGIIGGDDGRGRTVARWWCRCGCRSRWW